MKKIQGGSTIYINSIDGVKINQAAQIRKFTHSGSFSIGDLVAHVEYTDGLGRKIFKRLNIEKDSWRPMLRKGDTVLLSRLNSIALDVPHRVIIAEDEVVSKEIKPIAFEPSIRYAELDLLEDSFWLNDPSCDVWELEQDALDFQASEIDRLKETYLTKKK